MFDITAQTHGTARDDVHDVIVHDVQTCDIACSSAAAEIVLLKSNLRYILFSFFRLAFVPLLKDLIWASVFIWTCDFILGIVVRRKAAQHQPENHQVLFFCTLHTDAQNRLMAPNPCGTASLPSRHKRLQVFSQRENGQFFRGTFCFS